MDIVIVELLECCIVGLKSLASFLRRLIATRDETVKDLSPSMLYVLQLSVF